MNRFAGTFHSAIVMPRPRHATRVATHAAFAAALAALFHPAPARADEPVIRMAGTFNNWGTSDDEYRMARVGDRYELVRVWQPGVYEFKFVFDGSWAKHLGGSEDGTLVQPGANIGLIIYESGRYAVIYHRTENRWEVERRDLDAGGAKALPANSGVVVIPNPVKADMNPAFKPPDWAKRAVWYQIFPERFRNGDPTNDPPRTVPWTHAWYRPYDDGKSKSRNVETSNRQNGEQGARKDSRTSDEKSKSQKVKKSKPAGGGFRDSGEFWNYIFERRYGGDIQGIGEKLPYLRNLGVNAIYLNPIFQAPSLHKYDTSDYRHVDDFFGVKASRSRIIGETADPKTWQWTESDKVFLRFLKEAHRQGFKVIIDGVFNHVGREFWAFQDVMKNGPKSPYAGWFDIASWTPLHYKAWDKDDGTLPRLKHDDALGLAEPVREHLFAITRRWMDPNGDGDPSDGIDGWRLDVAGDINANFWKDWRKRVKEINPDAYIVAESWEESKQWLDGETFDAVMNYPFARACQRFFVNQKKATKPTEFDTQLKEMLNWYPPQVNHVLQNLFDSHDTDRAASMFMNPDLEYDKANRQQDNGPSYNVKRPSWECYERLKLMVCAQMTFLGAPMIYYGDEVGMFGADDPSCRKPMLWDDLMPYDDPDEHIEPGLFDYYQRLIAIRNTYPALQLGSFEPLATEDDLGVFAFARSLDNQQIVVVLNNSDAAYRLEIPVPWPDGISATRLDDPRSGELLQAESPAARATVRPTSKRTSDAKVEHGQLRGCMIAPRAAGIFVKS